MKKNILKRLIRHIKSHSYYHANHMFAQVFHISISDSLIHLMAFIGVMSFQLQELADKHNMPDFVQSALETATEKYWIIFMRIGANPHKEVFNTLVYEAEMAVETIL